MGERETDNSLPCDKFAGQKVMEEIQRKSYSEAVIEGVRKRSRMFVGDSIVGKIDRVLNKGDYRDKEVSVSASLRTTAIKRYRCQPQPRLQGYRGIGDSLTPDYRDKEESNTQDSYTERYNAALNTGGQGSRLVIAWIWLKRVWGRRLWSTSNLERQSYNSCRHCGVSGQYARRRRLSNLITRLYLH